MAKQSKPKPNVCCPAPFPIREIIWGDSTAISEPWQWDDDTDLQWDDNSTVDTD